MLVIVGSIPKEAFLHGILQICAVVVRSNIRRVPAMMLFVGRGGFPQGSVTSSASMATSSQRANCSSAVQQGSRDTYIVVSM